VSAWERVRALTAGSNDDASGARVALSVAAAIALAALSYVVLWLPHELKRALDDASLQRIEERERALESARGAIARIAQERIAAEDAHLARVLADPLEPTGALRVWRDGVRIVPPVPSCDAHAPLAEDEELAHLVAAVRAAAARRDAVALEGATREFLALETHTVDPPLVRMRARLALLEALVASNMADGALMRALTFSGLATHRVEPLAALLVRAHAAMCAHERDDVLARAGGVARALGGSLGAVTARIDEDAQASATAPQTLPSGTAATGPALVHHVALAARADGLVVGVAVADIEESLRATAWQWGYTVSVPAPSQPVAIDALDVVLTPRGPDPQETVARTRAAIDVATASGVGGVGVLAAFVVLTMRRGRKSERLRRDLVTAVTHELRTPLASMRLQVEALERNVGAADAVDKSRAQLTRLGADIDSLEGLVENVLSYGRLARGGVVLVRARVSLRDLCEAIREQVLRERSDVDVQLGDDDVEAYCDAELVQLVISNLVRNAYKHNPRADRVVRVRIERAGAEVRVAVEDNGAGIDSADRARIFRPFERALSLSRGSGLGLTVAREIARLHGGDVALARSDASGSVFILTLPAGGGA
jgi:signal transduction histidine kinase